jgi:hypothetical protein
MREAMSPGEFEAALRAGGAVRYDNRQPLHRLMREGRWRPEAS